MIALVYPLILVELLNLSGGWVWALLPFNIALIPALDQIVRMRWPHWRVPAGVLRFVFAPPMFWIYAASQALALLAVLSFVRTHPISLITYLGLASSTGIMTGTAGITAAHELVHRRSPVERGLGVGLLMMVSYPQFRIEHVYGHHRHVGTKNDPASATIGESYPRFLGKSIIQGFINAWRIEQQRVLRQGSRALGLGNRMIQYCIMQIAVYTAIAIWTGPKGVLFFVLQSMIAVHLLEAVNYVQHYGLARKVTIDGNSERVTAAHSWDGDDPISGLLSFRIGTHAEHHASAQVPCAELTRRPEARQLPFSFFFMVFMALIPPLWHAVMDEKVWLGSRQDQTKNPLFSTVEQP